MPLRKREQYTPQGIYDLSTDNVPQGAEQIIPARCKDAETSQEFYDQLQQPSFRSPSIKPIDTRDAAASQTYFRPYAEKHIIDFKFIQI